MLNEIGAPLYTYKNILEWAYEAHISNFNFDTSHHLYHQTIRYLGNNLQFNISWPKNILVNIIKDQKNIYVVIFDVEKTILSFLTDTSLYQTQNLVINTKNKFARFKLSNNCY